jgi:hypothetical protein
VYIQAKCGRMGVIERAEPDNIKENRMAKFDVLYPNQPTNQLNEDIYFEGSSLVKVDDTQPCWNCKEPTSWIDINFEAYLCSEECERAKWKEYYDAERSRLQRESLPEDNGTEYFDDMSAVDPQHDEE